MATVNPFIFVCEDDIYDNYIQKHGNTIYVASPSNFFVFPGRNEICFDNISYRYDGEDAIIITDTGNIKNVYCHHLIVPPDDQPHSLSFPLFNIYSFRIKRIVKGTPIVKINFVPLEDCNMLHTKYF